MSWMILQQFDLETDGSGSRLWLDLVDFYVTSSQKNFLRSFSSPV